MQVYVRETLHVLDYQDKIVDTIFNSEDHITPGYAYNISITESNTGYSDLKFDMPNIILTDTADKIKNPKLKLLTPLVKLRYHRQIYYMGEQSITVREPKGYGDKIEYIEVTYNKGDIIENYIMDYIVQPIDKKRNSLEVDTTFTAMDYPRFNLSKKRVGLTIDNETISKDWSIIAPEPIDTPGKIKYVKWNSDLSAKAGNPNIPDTWDPETATDYPLTKDNIKKLMSQIEEWPYGLLATAFYWPITSTYRYKGVMYKEGSFLALNLYDFFALTTEGIDPELSVGRYAWEWFQVYENEKYLSPNNARNYLGYVLEGTNWSIAQRPKRDDNGDIIDGEYEDDVDIIQKTISNPKGSIDSTEIVDLQASINVGSGNCYNAITAISKTFQVYPIFDCINRTVALRQFAGSNYGLVYALGRNIKDDSTRHDGEKVITKLYCAGGQDHNGDYSINIGKANRSSFSNFAGFYSADTDLPEPYYSITCNDCYHSFDNDTMVQECPECHGNDLTQVFMGMEGHWAIVDSKFTSEDFEYQTYVLETYEDQGEEKIRLKPVTATAHDMNTNEFWVAGDNRQVYFWDNDNQVWVLGEEQETGLWTYDDYIVDPITGTQGGTWNPNDDVYINCRSPWGTNYILNLKWMYQNKWITKGQILNLYQKEWLINAYNLSFLNKYTQDYKNTRELYNEAMNNYDIEQDKHESTLNAMMNKYYINDNKPSDGSVLCFHVPAPVGTFLATDPTDGQQKRFVKLFHCYTCGKTGPLTPMTYNFECNTCHHTWQDVYPIAEKCPQCGGTDIDMTENLNAEPADIDICPYCQSDDVANNNIWIPTYQGYGSEFFTIAEGDYPYGSDYNQYRDKGYAYNPRLKGYFFKLVTTLDRQSGVNEHEEGKTVEDYEKIVSLIEPIALRVTDEGQELNDDYRYVVNEGGHDIYVRSATGQIEVWNHAISDYITAYGNMLSFRRKMDAYLHKIQMLDEAYDEWSEKVKEINTYIQEHYGDYLVEGNYTNDEQVYIDLLFQEGLEASGKYSVPEVTYNLGVIDSSGLIEYRRPTITKYYCANCDYMSYSPFLNDTCPRCGHNLIITENDVYNDLVKSLHSVGQIVPKAGDYVTIYDEPMGFYGIPGLITKITRYPDKPINNKIEVDTSYTDDEELVGNIITATNMVLNNTDIYTRTAVLKSDGTIDPNSIRETLDNNNANITIVGTDGNILLDGSGLRATDPTNEGYAMKYTGKGIFSTSTNGATWESMMTPQGINATYINSGTIDTNKLNIVSGKGAKVVMDQYGLTVRTDSTKNSHITEFNVNQALGSSAYASNWGRNNNISSFIGVDTKNDPLIYTKGFLVANEGSNIANWITSNNGFYHLTNQGKKDLWLSPTGMNRSEYSDNASLGEGNTSFMIYAADKFGVDTSGRMYSISGKIAGYTITEDTLYGSQVGMDAESGGHYAFWAGADVDHTGDAPFRVGHDGSLVASSATINGNVTATSGTIGGCSIVNGVLQVKDANIDTLTVSKITSGTNAATMTFNGSITCNNLTASNNGHIAGWSINSWGLKGDTNDIALYKDGRLTAKKKGWFNAGDAGYWLIGQGNSVPCFLGDSYEQGNSIADSVGSFNREVGGARTSSIGICAKAGDVHIRSTVNNGCIRLATLSNGGICLDAGYTGTARPGAVTITGTREGDGHLVTKSAVYLYAPNGSIRLNSATNIWQSSSGSIILQSEGNGNILGGNFNIGESSTYGVAVTGKIGAPSTNLYIKGSLYSSSSSRKMKTNIKPIPEEERKEIYNIVKNMPFYSYYYKPEYDETRSLFHGFVIEDIEKTKIAEYLHFTQDKNNPDIKNFSGLELSKLNLLLIQQLQKEIERLEKELDKIKKEKTN